MPDEAFRHQLHSELPEDVPFFLQPVTLDLVKDHAELIEVVRATLGGTTPVAIVLDTLNRSLVGSESSDTDMSNYVRAADAIRDAFGCSVLVVHHCGINDSRPRGHTSLTGAADAQLAVKRDGGGNIFVTVEFMKDGTNGESIASRLEAVEVGTDEDGEPITSCVVVASEACSAKTPKRGKSLSKSAQIALKALQMALTKAGEQPPASNYIPPNVRTVSLNLWREYAYGLGISGSDEQRAKQAAFKRGAEALLAAELVGGMARPPVVSNMSPRTKLAYKRTLLKECVRLCSPTGNVRQNVRLSAERWRPYALSEFENVRLCSRTNEQMFAVRLCSPSGRFSVERRAEKWPKEARRIRRGVPRCIVIGSRLARGNE